MVNTEKEAVSQPCARWFLVFSRMAWRNVWRNPLRSLLTLSALAVAMMVMIFYAALVKGMTQQMIALATETTTGHLQVHRAAFYRDRDLYATLPWAWLAELEKTFPEWRFSPRAYAAGLASSDSGSVGVSIQGVVLEKELQTTQFLSHVQRGRLWGAADVFTLPESESEREADQGEATVRLVTPVALGLHLARQLNVEIGDEIVLMTQALDGSIGNDIYQVNAIFEPIAPDFDRKGLVMSLRQFKDLMALDSGFHELVVRTGSPQTVSASLAKFEIRIADLTAASPLDALGGPVEVRSWQTLTPMVSEMVGLSRAMMFVVGAVLVGLAALGLLNTLLMSLHERTHELGILRALGIRSWALFLLLLAEVLCLGSLAIVIGTVFGVLLTLWVGRTGIDFSEALPEGFDWGGVTFEPVMPVVLDAHVIVPAALLMLTVIVCAVVMPLRHLVKRSPVALLS